MGGRELARLGVPSDRLQPVYTIAKRGCAQYEKGAQCLSTAADIPAPIPGTAAERKFNQALDCGFKTPGKGGLLLAQAGGKGFEIKAAAGSRGIASEVLRIGWWRCDDGRAADPSGPALVLGSWAAVVAAVIWLALGLFLGFRSLSRQVEGSSGSRSPGQAEVSLAEPGGYTVYFQGLGASDEQVPTPPYRLLLMTANGEEVPVRPYGGSATYGFEGHSGRAVATFSIEEPGRFLLQTEGESQGGEANLAVGRSVGPAILRTVTQPIVGALVLSLAGAVLAVVVAVRRNRARRMLPAAAAQPAGSWGQGPVAAGWFADPGRRHELRYWDGQRWTEHVSDRGTQGVDAM